MTSIIQKSLLDGSEVILIQYLVLVSVATLTASSSLRVIGGRDAKEHEFPFVIRLEHERIYTKNNISRTRYQFACTGSALAPQWTLTAGHCLYEPCKKVVGYGTLRGKSKLSKRSYILEEFNRFEKRYGRYEDIALLKTEPVTIEKYGKLSAFDYASLLYQEVTVAGYGDTNSTDSDVELSLAYSIKPLQVMKGMLVSCVDVDSQNTLGYLCFNAKCSRPATPCPGDSGSPYIHSTGIIGVDSGGPVENNCQMVSDFFRTPYLGYLYLVSPFVDWINKVVNSEDTKLLGGD